MKDEITFREEMLGKLEAVCREQAIPLTVQRRVVMECLAGRRDHPTADQIYDEVRSVIKGVSRTTVYRVLDTFVVHGVAQKISNPEAKARFDADTSRHHHVQCTRCGAVADIHDRELNSIALPSGESSGFEIVDYSINFKGTCLSCRKAA